MAIKPDDRLIAVGKTGSGKTTLIETLTRNLPRLVVLDGKGKLTNWGLDEFTDDAQERFFQNGRGRLRAVLPVGEVNPAGYWDRVFQFAFDAGNLTVYIDEIGALCPPGVPASPMMHSVYTRGREFGIGVWGSTQRPAWIPLVCISECEHWFAFRLSLVRDRERMAEFGGDELLKTVPDPFGFWYRSIEDDSPRYYKRLRV